MYILALVAEVPAFFVSHLSVSFSAFQTKLLFVTVRTGQPSKLAEAVRTYSFFAGLFVGVHFAFVGVHLEQILTCESKFSCVDVRGLIAYERALNDHWEKNKSIQ